MPNVLIRDLDEKTIARLKKRAERNKRSLQAEMQLILERAASVDPVDSRELAARIRRKLSGGRHSDSTELIAEDRQR